MGKTVKTVTLANTDVPGGNVCCSYCCHKLHQCRYVGKSLWCVNCVSVEMGGLGIFFFCLFFLPVGLFWSHISYIYEVCRSSSSRNQELLLLLVVVVVLSKTRFLDRTFRTCETCFSTPSQCAVFVPRVQKIL